VSSGSSHCVSVNGNPSPHTAVVNGLRPRTVLVRNSVVSMTTAGSVLVTPTTTVGVAVTVAFSTSCTVSWNSRSTWKSVLSAWITMVQVPVYMSA